VSKNLAERNAALYKMLNDIDDRRERFLRKLSAGPHEPCSAFGHYDVEDVDDGGRLIERRERGIGMKFIPVTELPASLTEMIVPNDEALEPAHVPGLPDTSDKPVIQMSNEMWLEEVRHLTAGTQRPSVRRRRRSTLHAV